MMSIDPTWNLSEEAAHYDAARETEVTPTTPEVRDSFDWYDRNQANPLISTADFDRWLDAHDAEVAAGALRAAADEVEAIREAASVRWGTIYGPDPEEDAMEAMMADPADWLQSRADEVQFQTMTETSTSRDTKQPRVANGSPTRGLTT